MTPRYVDKAARPRKSEGEVLIRASREVIEHAGLRNDAGHRLAVELRPLFDDTHELILRPDPSDSLMNRIKASDHETEAMKALICAMQVMLSHPLEGDSTITAGEHKTIVDALNAMAERLM